MAVIYKPTTVRDYYETLARIRRVHEEYDAITDPEKASAFHEEHWEDLKAYVEPPAVNLLILQEFMEREERFTAHFAAALREFAPLEYIPEGIPSNAATLWRHIVAGVHRVADRLTAPLEK
jgi:hypothetical protein